MPRRILVIEDNKDLAHLLEIHLRDLSFEVQLAFDGPSGLAAAESKRYDLIILDLTAREFDLLYHFVRHPGGVFTRSQLLDVVWGYGHDGYEHTVNSHINRLPAKIEANPSKPQFILTVWGVGYKFAEKEDCYETGYCQEKI